MVNEIERDPLIDAIDIAKKKAEMLIENIKSKEMIEDFLHEKITKEELAYMLAEDANLLRTTKNVTEGIINPKPTDVMKANRDNIPIDLAFGFSTFLEEMKKPINQKVTAAAQVREIVDNVSIASNKSENPNMRADLYEKLGLDEEQIAILVPEEEVEEYRIALMEHFRGEHMDRLNMKSIDELSDVDKEMIENLVSDSMSMVESGNDQLPNNFSYGGELNDGYMDEYGMSPEDLNALFADAIGEDIYDYPPFEEIHNLDNYPTMDRAIHNIEAMYNDTIEGNKESLSKLETPIQDEILSDDDINDLDGYLDYLSNSEPPNLSDDDLADLNGLGNEDQIGR